MGVGKNAWAAIHVADSACRFPPVRRCTFHTHTRMFADAELTYLLFCAALTGNAKLGHGREGYYLTENGEEELDFVDFARRGVGADAPRDTAAKGTI